MTTTTHGHPRRSWRFLALLGCAALTASLGAGAISLALFTDTDAVTGGPFSTGTIQIDASPATVDFEPQPMFPGDIVEDTIDVANTGTGALRYSMRTTVVSGASLAGQLELTVWLKTGAACADGGPTFVTPTALSGAGFGDNAQGYQLGDRDLAAGATDTLCFSATLPIGTDNSFQNASTQVTFTFDAEQTANN